VEGEGWRLDRQSGSHRQFRHPDHPGTVTVAGKLSADIPRGTLASIWRQTGWSPRVGMTEYVVVIEQDGDSWGASVPDLPGCVAVGDSRDEVELLIAEAILLHIQSLRDDGETIPAPSATGSTKVRVA
jgi:predicted RNase H-like HicB family nuclease/predicted RNA binding protein YcfA (HicA-like mRNA interferase family)